MLTRVIISLVLSISVSATSAEDKEIPLAELGKQIFPILAQQELPPVNPNASCGELYNEVTRLDWNMRNMGPGFYEDPRNKAAVVASVYFRPAVLFWGYSALEDHLKQQNRDAMAERIWTLRGMLAQRLCFVR